MPRGSVTTQQGVPSIGIAYLASSLEKNGHETSVVDAFGEAIDQFTAIRDTNLLINGLTADEIVDRIPANTDIIGVSCMYSNEWIYSKDVIRKIIEAFPATPVIGGGEHFTAEPEYSYRSCPGLHSVVLGEGEETLAALVDAIIENRPLDSVNGIAFRRNGEIVRTPPHPRIRQIDEIPIPSWDGMPLESYLDKGLGMSSVRGRNMPMLASRGCPYACTFCSNPMMWTQRWISREPKLVLREMKRWIDLYAVNHIEFYDLTAIVKRDWIIEFSKLLIEANLGVTWALPSGTRSEALDGEVLEALKASGCHSLTYAPESGSPATLKRIKKKVKLPKMIASMRSAVEEGIWIKANMIVGFPGQTKKEVWESFLFMVEMAWVGIQDVAVFPFVPYPGSELFRQLLDEGRIDRSDPDYENFLAGNVYNEVSGMLSWSEHLSHRQTKFLTVGGMAWFYGWQFLFRPWRLLGTIKRIASGQPQTMFDMAVSGLLQNFVTKRRKLRIRGTESVDGSKEIRPRPSFLEARP
ncbi:MAG: cobalamin-dependent protein [Planctomycetota bacterium]|nr:cobalamin-dependent protein [Planctomycetota bacterium]